MSASDAELAKYEAWIREIESRRAKLAANRAGYQRFFLGALVASPLAFFAGLWIGAAATFTGVLVCVFGLYVLAIRDGDYARELEGARAHVERIRRG